eukprot:3535685-Amphidinium_carterae.1
MSLCMGFDAPMLCVGCGTLWLRVEVKLFVPGFASLTQPHHPLPLIRLARNYNQNGTPNSRSVCLNGAVASKLFADIYIVSK